MISTQGLIVKQSNSRAKIFIKPGQSNHATLTPRGRASKILGTHAHVK